MIWSLTGTPISDPVEIGGLDLHVGASIGIATFPEAAIETASLIHAADLMMYAAKEAGGNRVRIHAQADRDQDSETPSQPG